MSFSIKSTVLASFAKISTQPAAPISNQKISFTDPVGTPLTKNVKNDLIQVADILKKANGAILAVDKNSTHEFNYLAIQQSYLSKIVSNYDPSTLAHAFPRFKPYESLTGLTTTRPEVIMTMTFKPLFTDQKREDAVAQESGQYKTFTNEGELLDSQIQLFNLKYEAFSKLISDMKKNSEAQKVLVDNEDQFLAHIDKLSAQANFLRSIVLTFENLKQFMNIRSSRSKVDFSTVVYNYFKTISTDLKSDIISRFQSDTNFFKILGECGFTEENAKNFSNTKIYLQSLYELKKLLISASDEMTGIDGSQKLNDSDATSLIKTKILDFNREISLNIQNLKRDELRSIQPDNLKTLSSKVTAAFKYLNTIQAATPDDRIALFYHLVSKEYSYSYALADASFVRFAEQTFGYKTSQTNNLQMFDTFIGHPGNRIVDAVYSLSPNSAMSIAQQDKGDFLVLPFETDYIDYDSSIFSPGATYYVDEALKVSQTGLSLDRTNELRVLADNQTKYQSALYKYLIPRLQNTFNNDTVLGEKISNSSSLFNMCMSTFLDPTTKALKAPFAKSNLGIVFDKARSDAYLKSLLFLYFMVRSLGVAKDDEFHLKSRGVIEEIAAKISARMQASTQSASKTSMLSILNSGGSVSSKVATSIETELKNASAEFTNLFAAQLSAIWNTFYTSKCFNGDSTKYSGMSTSALFLMIFEMMFQTFSRINDKKAVSFVNEIVASAVNVNTRSSNLYQMKVIDAFGTSRLAFSVIVNNKLQFENDLVLKVVMTHLNMFDALQNAIRNSIVTFQKSENVKTLNDTLKIVESNDNLTLLMNEPQINLVKNAVDDINSKFDARLRSNYKKETDRLDVAAAYLKDQNNDLVLFDDFLIPSQMKQILYEYFSNEKFSVNRGFNSRILSIGIPQGFAGFLKEKVSLENVSKKTYSEKEADVVKVNVYKVDVRYQNLVFKPQSFLFEMSRFVSKDYSSYLPVKEGSSEQQIAESIPIRDYSLISDVQLPAVTYGRDSSLFRSSEYDFLTSGQKDSILTNHIRSHMLELYIKLLSGFSVNELDFLIDETSSKISSMSPIIINKLIDTNTAKQVVIPKAIGVQSVDLASKEVKLTSKVYTVKQTQKIDKRITVVPLAKVSQNYESQNNVIVAASKTRTLYSDTMDESRRIMKPKVFDRIFNIFVDPDDFEIDQIETNRTESGRDMLDSLFSSGKVISVLDQTILRSTELTPMARMKLIDKNPKENDAVFEKYFITLETVLGDLV